MFKKMLFPITRSRLSEKLFLCAKNFKSMGTEEIVFVHVINARDAGNLAEKFKRYWESRFEEMKRPLEEEGWKIRYYIPIGLPVPEILRVAREERVSLIVMGIPVHRILPKFFFTSYAEEVLRNARCPVFVARCAEMEKANKEAYEACLKRPFRKILYPTDFSDPSWKALRYVKKLGQAVAKDAVVMHVQDVRKRVPEVMKKLSKYDRIDLQALNKIKRELETTGIRAKTLLVEGVPFVAINKVAERENASLIVMGSHGRSSLKEMLIGSTTENVVRNTDRAILVIHRQDIPEEKNVS